MNSYGEQIEKQVLCTAFSATCEKRKSIFSKDDIETTLHLVSNDLHMAELWGQFQKSNYPEIFQTASGKSVSLLSWSHYAVLLQVKDKEARDWYEKEAASRPGVLELYNGIFYPSITIVCSKRRRQCFIFNSRKQSFEQSANSQREPEQCKELGTG